jgi:small subunit ribosomal protein S4
LEKRKISEYGKKLNESRKIRHFYGSLRAKDLRRIVWEAANSREKSHMALVRILESRLATFVYRIKWGITPSAAKQLINHGKVFVNGKRVSIPSYRLSPGDNVELKVRDNPHVLASMQTSERTIPDNIESKGLEGVFLKNSTIETVVFPKTLTINFTSIVEFFTR